MIEPHFLRQFTFCTLLTAVLALGFITVVNPYNASPIDIRLDHFNTIKPKSRDVDRLVKPFQVWLRQPKTIFLGTSRIHQSIDPRVLDDSVFATAYNASIPASSLGMNIAHLRQYFLFDPALKHVFIELFAYNFLGQGQDYTEKTLREFLINTASLFASSDALWDSTATVAYNLGGGSLTYEVDPEGYFSLKPGHDAQGTFSAFPSGIWSIFKQGGQKIELSATALQTAHTIATVARAHGVEPVFIATPDHAYFDYFIDLLDKWDVLETWLKTMSAEGTVLSFAQPNVWTQEEPGPSMTYWNDPFHFSLTMGKAMQQAILGQPPADAPANFMVRLTPENVPEIIAQRRNAIRDWAARHPAFVERMRGEMELALGADEAMRIVPSLPPRGSLSGTSLIVDGVLYPIVDGIGGSIEGLTSVDQGGIVLDGWTADTRTAGGATVKGIAAVVNGTVIRISHPDTPRADITAGFGAGVALSGFHIILSLPQEANKAKILLLALTADGHAVPISNGLSSDIATLLPIPFPAVAEKVQFDGQASP